MLALLGIGPLSLPIVQYDSGGSVNYNNTTDTYMIAATPLTIDVPGNPTGFFFTGAVNVNIKVDSAGALIGGVPGDDFKVSGDVDIDGDFVVDYFAINGPLLTGEISHFGFLDTGGSTDRFDFRFTVTGGQLASHWAGKDIGVVTTSETSNFVNDFNVDFHGGAKGQIGAIDKQSAQLSGHKYTDLTGAGFSGDDTPLGGVTINLYQDNGTVGVLDGPDVLYTSDVTDTGGAYWFADLAAGNYLVQEAVPAGYQNTTPTTLAVSLIAGDNITTGFDFDNFQYAHITGTKFTDITGDSFSADDTGLGSVTINLYLGTSTSGPLVASTTTAADGSYSFGNLGPGTYFVQEVVQSGWIQTGGNAGYTIAATSGLNSTGNNFDNFQKGQITGKKYKDITGNSFSADDTGLGGVTIKLYQGTSTSGTLVASTTTAADGSYSFGNIGPGTYFVQEVVQTGWIQTGGNAGYTIVATSGLNCTGNNFDNFQKGQITGKKYKDLTGNSFSADDTGLGGVMIKLYQGTSTSGTLVASTTTAADGSYSFGNLGPGTYFVQEVVQSGWTQTGGNAGYTIMATSGFNCTGNNFDNFQNGTIRGAKYLDLTGNGLTADDTALGGVTIQLYRDANNDGQLTGVDGGPVATTVTTAGTGAYSFGNVAAGTYFVKEVVGSNYVSTAPTSGQYKVVVAACGSITTGLNFANFDTSDCACDITNITYLIDGYTTVTDLRGNTNQGDVVQVTFTIVAGAEPHQYTLVSYTAPGAVFDPNTASQQQVFDFDTGFFGPGTYTLEVRIPNSFYQIDFVCGALIDRFGPAGSNIFYGAQGRLLSADNDGSVAVLSNGASLAGMVFVDGNKNNVRDLGEVGIGNTKVTLTGTTSQGQYVSVVGYTKSDGTYLFDNLKSGKYAVSETQPAGFGDGADILGSLGGSRGSDAFTNINVAASAKGINYNFGEKLTSLGSGYSAGFQVDPANSSKSVIVVNGTSGTDVITVSYSNSKYKISLNGTSIGSLANKDSSNRSVARLIINGGNGNDDITVDSSVTIMTELNGGAGHDRLDGSGGYNILVGGNGSDTLLGGPLVNLMIGGNGADVIIGGSAADLIVAGSTSHGSNATALRAIFAEWTSSRDYNTRINNLLGVGSGTRSNANYFFSADKMFDDGEVDRITNAAGRDWLFAHLGMTATDVVTDLAGDERVTGI